jgi:iron(III) transport system substrate-binding protein
VPADQVPQEWTDLLKPEFKNAVSMNDPNTSGPAYPVIANILSMMGMEKGKQFFLDLKKNGAKFFPDAGSAKNAVSTGAVKVDILQDTSAINLIQSGSPVGLVYPKSGVAFLSSYVAIQKNAPDMDAAKQFVNYLLTPEAQKIMLASTSNAAFFQPVINGVTPRPGRPENIKWNVLDNAWAADNENTIKQWFHDNVVQ